MFLIEDFPNEIMQKRKTMDEKTLLLVVKAAKKAGKKTFLNVDKLHILHERKEKIVSLLILINFRNWTPNSSLQKVIMTALPSLVSFAQCLISIKYRSVKYKQKKFTLQNMYFSMDVLSVKVTMLAVTTFFKRTEAYKDWVS